MAKKTEDRLREAVSDLGNATPLVRAGKAIAAVGDAADAAANTVKRAFAPILPGQSAPKRRGDIVLPKEGKRR